MKIVIIVQKTPNEVIHKRWNEKVLDTVVYQLMLLNLLFIGLD